MMKYTTEIIIELPRDQVIEKLDSTENFKHWQKGFVAAEHVRGTPGEEGAIMKIKYKMGKRDMELLETILKRDFPTEFHATYDTKGVVNLQQNFFEETAEGHTKWISKNEFYFTGFMMKMMGFLMPGAFKKQSCQYLENFKNFAEKGISVNEGS